ncbi:MAG TPA: diguanylate cyclase [Baekduia sp.]|nr:diguanylate cyclase [Baekduia sp.]
MAFDAAATAMLALSGTGVLLQANSAARRLLPQLDAMVRDRATLAQLSGHEHAGVVTDAVAAAQAGRATSGLQFAIGPAGTTVLSANLVALPPHDRSAPAVLVELHDVTDEHPRDLALAESEKRFVDIAENIPGLIYRCLVAVDGTASMEFSTERAGDAFGASADGMPIDPSTIVDRVHPDDKQSLDDEIARTANGRERFDWHGRVFAPDGTLWHVRDISQPHRQSDGSILWYGMLLNESGLADARQREQTALRRLRLLFEQAPVGMLLTDRAGVITQTNAALARLVGISARELEGQSLASLLSSDEAENGMDVVSAVLDDPDCVYRGERCLRAASHATLWAAISAQAVRGIDGEEDRVLVQLVDITERKDLERRLWHLADHDALTGLLNRRGFEAALAAHIGYCRRTGPRGALMIVDIDNFKSINDEHGHAVGDSAIVSVADVLAGEVRDHDIVARLGGDEFALLLTGTDTSDAHAIADRLVSTVGRRVRVDGLDERRWLSISLGGIMFESLTSLDAPRAVESADQAMYRAKRAGRAQYHFVDRF